MHNDLFAFCLSVFFISLLPFIFLLVLILQVKVRLRKLEYYISKLKAQTESFGANTERASTQELQARYSIASAKEATGLIESRESEKVQKSPLFLDHPEINREYLTYRIPFWIGAIALTVGFCFLMFTPGLLPGFIKLAVAAAVGSGMIWYGITRDNSQTGLGEGFVASGVGVLFAGIFEIGMLMEGSGSPLILLLSILVSSLGMHLGKKCGPLVAWVGLIGGMLAPLFMILNPYPSLLFCYLAPIVLGAYYVSKTARCHWVFLASISASLLWLMIWRTVPSMHVYILVPIIFCFFLFFLGCLAENSLEKKWNYKNVSWTSICVIPLLFALFSIHYKTGMQPIAWHPQIILLSWVALAICTIRQAMNRDENVALYLAFVGSFIAVGYMWAPLQIPMLASLLVIWIIAPQYWLGERSWTPALFKEHPVMSALMAIVLSSIWCAQLHISNHEYRVIYALCAVICTWFACTQTSSIHKNWLMGTWVFASMFFLQDAGSSGTLIMSAIMLFAWTFMFATDYQQTRTAQPRLFLMETFLLIVPSVLLLRTIPNPAFHTVGMIVVLAAVIITSKIKEDKENSLAAACIGFLALILSIPRDEWLPLPGVGPVFGLGLPVSTIIVCTMLFIAVYRIETNKLNERYHLVLERIAALSLVISAWSLARWLVSPLHQWIAPHVVNLHNRSIVIVPHENWDGWSGAAAMIALALSGLILIKTPLCRKWDGMTSIGRTAWKAAEIWAIFGLGVILNPLWTEVWVGNWPIINALPAMYLLPTLVILAQELKDHNLPKIVSSLWAGVVLGLLFITNEVHHLFQTGYLWGAQAEFYLYSVGWIAWGAFLLWLGAYTKHFPFQKAACAVLAMATCKVFLFDTFSLGGAWRIISFIGLGLSFMILGHFYSKAHKRELME